MVENALPASTFALRPAWWLVLCGLICYISLNFVLPALDPRVAEYVPQHDHLILSAAAWADGNRALAEHQHNAGRPDQHGAASHAAPAQVAADPDPAVISTGGGAGSNLASQVYQLLDLAVTPLVQPPLALWIVIIPAALLFALCKPPPLKQPPR
jgi:hypothetical protein